MPAGRPSKYNEEILIKAREYLDSCVDEVEEFHKTRGNSSDSFDRILKVKLPTLEGLSLYLHINDDTIQDWKAKYPEFSVIVGEILKKQADLLLSKGLSGEYNASIAKLILTKHGYRDNMELSGVGGKDLIPEILTQEERLKLKELLR